MQISLLKKLASYDHIIWDYNGTLLDDVEITCEAINTQLKKFALSSITSDQYRNGFCFPIHAYYEQLGFDPHQFDKINQGFLHYYRANRYRARLFPQTLEILNKLKNQGCRLSVLSAAHKADLKAGLTEFGAYTYFDDIVGVDNHRAEGKEVLGHKLASQHKLLTTVMVGDTDYDLQVAKAINSDIVIIAEGHQSWHRLKGLHPNVFESRIQH